MNPRIESEMGAAGYDRADSMEVIKTLMARLGGQGAAAAAVHANQPQVSDWAKGATSMTPGYMALARRLLFEADRRELFIMDFYKERLMVGSKFNPAGLMVVQDLATVTNKMNNGRNVTQRVSTVVPKGLMGLAVMVDQMITSYFTWSFHTCGDYFGFYKPAQNTGIITSVFYVDREDNTIGRGAMDPIFKITNPNKAEK